MRLSTSPLPNCLFILLKDQDSLRFFCSSQAIALPSKCCLLCAQFAHEFLQILGVEFRLLPGRKVPATGKIGKVLEIHLALSPFARQRSIPRTMGDGCRNGWALPLVWPRCRMSHLIVPAK